MRIKKRASRALLGVGVLVFVLALFASSGVAWATTFSTPIDADYSHISNSVYLSRDDFPDGAPAAVLAGSESYAEALTATVLAGAAEGPLLLTSSTSLSSNVRTELVRLKPVKVYVVGLSPTIVAEVKTALPALTADQIVVLAGADSYQTAAFVAGAVKQRTGDTPARVFIVPGDVYGSSLAAAAVAAGNGWPILLTPAAGPFPAASAQAIADLGVTKGIQVDTSVDPAVPGFVVEKTIMGTTSTSDNPGARYTEALDMAEYAVENGWADYTHLALGQEQGGSVAYSENFPDNVLLASHIARSDGAYLLARSTALHSTVVDLLRERGRDIDSVDFMRPDYDQVLSGAWSFGTIRQVKSLNSARVTGLSTTSGPLGGGGSLTVTGSGFTEATTVRIGKTNLAAGSWTINSDTSITVDPMPAATQTGAAEILVYNYWHVSPSNPRDVYSYASDSWPTLTGMDVVQEAIKYLGVPYVWAGSSPSGFDCSGFTRYVYGKFGISLPHKSTYQASYGTPVDKEDLLPGDLVFFGSPISHVGMYVGNGLMINAPRSGDLVTIEDVFRSSYVRARRLISPYTRVEENSPLLGYGGTWTGGTTTSASGGAYAYLNSPGAVTVTFDGIWLQWTAKKSSGYGIAKLTVDGKDAGTVDLYSSSTTYSKSWDTGLLPDGTHTVTIEWTGTKRAAATDTNISVDAFDVIGSVLQSPSQTGAARYQDTDSRVLYTGLWDSSTVSSASGGTFHYIDKAGSAGVTFTGTYLAWLAKKSPSYGIARVILDGNEVGTVDLYSAATGYLEDVWDTGTLPEGTHTVRIEWTGDKNPAATAANISLDAFDIVGSPVKPDGLTRYEQTDTHLDWAGTWGSFSASGASAGSYRRANTAGASVTVSFTGTYLSWVATAGTTLGKAYVSLDGGTAQSIDLARSAVGYQQSVWATGVLPTGSHTATIWWDQTNAAGKYISVDAFDVIGTLNQPGSEPPTPVRYEQTDTRFGWTGTWTTFSTSGASGGSYRRTNTGESSVTVSFTGTYLSWLATAGTTLGKAYVSLDGGPAQSIDLARSAVAYQQSVWNTGTLASGTHTVKIWRDPNNAAGKYISVDAFDVSGTLNQVSGEPPVAPTRYQQADPHFVYARTWTVVSDPAASNGSFRFVNTSGASVTVTFSGTYLAWIAKKSPVYGIAKVTLDGKAVNIDLYSPDTVWQAKAWDTGTLASGTHTVKIEWTGTKNSASDDYNISVDAFDVVGTLK